ncbi:MAG: hypothetical protein ACRD9R_21435, partial [Pyrinomonadaceae bacterium]
TENFDDETPPALPVGWSTLATAPGGKPWATTSAFSDTAPNSAATVADVQGTTTPTCTGGQGGATLTSEPIAIPNPPTEGINRSVQLRFRNFFNLETGFDGGALEISINGGAFQDIIAAGGSFASGGYNATLLVDPNNPLSGRRVWTGNSGGFITTLVNLPSSANGQSVQFRWRTGYDGCVTPANGGMRIDTISIFGSSRICNSCGIPRIVTTTVLTRVGGNVQADITIQNQGTGVANGVTLTQARLSPPTTDGAPLPQIYGDLGPGQSATRTVTFSGTNNLPGAVRVLQLRGTYNGGAVFTSARSVRLP